MTYFLIGITTTQIIIDDFLRHHPNPPDDSCSIVVSPELCDDPAKFTTSAGHHLCETHSKKHSSPLQLVDRPRPCDAVLPLLLCPQTPSWDYLEINDRRVKICEAHARVFKVIRPSFDTPAAEGGYDARRLCVCNLQTLMSAGCKCNGS